MVAPLLSAAKGIPDGDSEHFGLAEVLLDVVQRLRPDVGDDRPRFVAPVTNATLSTLKVG